MRVYLIGALVTLLFVGAAHLAVGGWGHRGALWDGHGWSHQSGHHEWRGLGDGRRAAAGASQAK